LNSGNQVPTLISSDKYLKKGKMFSDFLRGPQPEGLEKHKKRILEDEEEQALYVALMDYYDKNEELFIQLTTTL
jgi:hypothetical protein